MSVEARQAVARLLEELADALEGKTSGSAAFPAPGSSRRLAIGITVLGSEHGVAEMVKGARLAQAANPDVDVVLIGPEALDGRPSPRAYASFPQPTRRTSTNRWKGFSTLMRSPPA